MKTIAASPEIREGIEALKERKVKPVTATEVAAIVEQVIANLSGDISLMDVKLYSELEALARFIQNAKADIAAVRPEEISSRDIPAATDELDAVVGATEDATGAILDSAEQLEAIAQRLSPEHEAEIIAVVTRIYEACNFQDITGQRIGKVVRTLKHIEERVSAILTAFGDEIAKIKGPPTPDAPVDSAAPPTDSEPQKDSSLLNGPAMPDEAKRQAEIDAILASFSWNRLRLLMAIVSLLSLALVGAMLVSFLGSEANAAAMRSAQHAGYARLVFDFDDAPTFQATVVDEQLIVRFQQSYTGPLDANALNGVSGYIVQPKLSSDKRTLTFDLKRSLTIKSFTHKRSAVIDLIEAAAPAAPAPPAAPPAAPMQGSANQQAAKLPAPAAVDAAPSVPVRVGSHADFVRLVFDWDRTTDYDAGMDDGLARIRFARDGQIDEAAVKRQLPKAIGDWQLVRAKDGLSIRFATPQGAKVRHYRNANHIVVDILIRPDANPITVAATKPPATPPTAPSLQIVNAPAPPAPPAPAAPAVPARTASLVALSPSLTAPIAPPVTPPVSMIPVRAGSMRPACVSPVDVAVTVTGAGKALAVRFPWLPPPPAAMFVRGRSVYLVFSQPARFDLTALKKGEKLAVAERLAATNAAMMRVPLLDGASPSLERDERGWTLHLRPVGTKRPDVGLPVTIESNSPEGGKVHIGVVNAAQPIEAPDPDTGERLKVVATPDAGKGIDGERQFAQFLIWPSLQGVVIRPRTDALEINVTPSQVTIAGGLTVSRLAGKSGIAQAYNFSRWQENDVDFTETKQALQRAVAEGDGQNRPAVMFDLAQFFLAHDHLPDGLAVISNLVESNAQFGDDAALKALRGAALTLKGDYAAAMTDLADNRLDTDPSALNWRGLAKARLGDWAAADDLFRKAGAPGKNLPANMGGEMLLAAAQAALHTGDLKRSRQLTDILARPDIAPDLRARSELVRAEGYLQAGDKRSGVLILERVMASENREIRGIATSLWVEQKLADGSLPLSAAIDRLEKVRYAWGGGDLEYQALRRLGQLYFQNGDVRTALERWKEAVTFFPNRPENPQMRVEMTDAFVSLYDRATRDRVAPLAALAMYDDFRDLTPPGERGDRMIQDLADRLVSIDLLDRAAALLEYQIRHRLTGVERAKVGLRLTLVQMIDRQPSRALEALSMSEAANLPAELAAERKRMRAQALMETGNLTAALAAFEGDTSLVADELRAEIFRRGQKWPEAIKALQRVVATAKDGPLDGVRQKAVLNLAIARVLAQDDEGVRRMRDEFGPRMQASAHKQAFDVLVSANADITGVDVVAITQRFAALAEFQTAMANYREKLRDSGLSSIN